MPVLTCKQGQHDFKPSALPLPMRAKRLHFNFALFPECWYDSLGDDNWDWNKGPGVYQWLDFKKNQNALMLGWRPNLLQPGKFGLVPYENINGGNVPNDSKLILISAEEEVEGYLEPSPEGYQIWLLGEGGKYQFWHQSALKTKCIGKIDGWFGGNQTAPRTMRMYLNLYH
jgi:hypothetical protein